MPSAALQKRAPSSGAVSLQSMMKPASRLWCMERLLLAQYAVGLLIRCGRCSTTFQLDEASLPVGGASVQCSRCQLEFWAARPGDEPPTLIICPRCTTRFWLATSVIAPE